MRSAGGLSRRQFLWQAGAALALTHVVRALPAVAQEATPTVVAIDPGHGGRYAGAVLHGPGGILLAEKEINLDIALRLADLLRQAGLQPVLTRDVDGEVNPNRDDLNANGRADEDDDLQARVDVANEAGAALFWSIHHNGLAASEVRGTSSFFCQHHSRGDEAQALCQLLQAHLLDALTQLGYSPRDLGARDDAGLNKPYGHLFLAGPATPRVLRPSAMPTVVGEALFVTNPLEGELLARDDTRQALAQAYFQATLQFLDWSAA